MDPMYSCLYCGMFLNYQVGTPEFPLGVWFCPNWNKDSRHPGSNPFSCEVIPYYPTVQWY